MIPVTSGSKDPSATAPLATASQPTSSVSSSSLASSSGSKEKEVPRDLQIFYGKLQKVVRDAGDNPTNELIADLGDKAGEYGLQRLQIINYLSAVREIRKTGAQATSADIARAALNRAINKDILQKLVQQETL